MEHTTQSLQPPVHAPADPERPRGYTIRVPKPNWQVTALILIALIAAFQMIQLVRLKGAVVPKTSAATAASTTAPSAGSTSGLESQVGGC